jgi:transposase
MDAGYRVHLAHPSAIKKYERLKHSGDFADAAYLPQLLRLGLLVEGYIYPREERGVRATCRASACNFALPYHADPID